MQKFDNIKVKADGTCLLQHLEEDGITVIDEVSYVFEEIYSRLEIKVPKSRIVQFGQIGTTPAFKREYTKPEVILHDEPIFPKYVKIPRREKISKSHHLTTIFK